MKMIFQACIASAIIHLLYIVGSIGVGYIKTKNYEPDITGKWDSVNYLQNEVSFGFVISPLFYIYTFIGTAVICGLLIFLYKKAF